MDSYVCRNHSIVDNWHTLLTIEMLDHTRLILMLLNKSFQRVNHTCENSDEIQSLKKRGGAWFNLPKTYHKIYTVNTTKCR